jgi:hypothetical protein
MTSILPSCRQIGYVSRKTFVSKNLLCHPRRQRYAPSNFCQCLHQRIVLDHVHQFGHLFHLAICQSVPLLKMMIRCLFTLVMEAGLDLLFVSCKDLLLRLFSQLLVFCELIYQLLSLEELNHLFSLSHDLYLREHYFNHELGYIHFFLSLSF